MIPGFRSETVTINGTRLHYWIGGDPHGQPVMDHGDDPRQILTQGRLRPGVQADAEAAARMVGARTAC